RTLVHALILSTLCFSFLVENYGFTSAIIVSTWSKAAKRGITECRGNFMPSFARMLTDTSGNYIRPITHHRSERGRATLVADSHAMGRPRRSVLRYATSRF